MEFLKLNDFKNQVGNTVIYHYLGLEPKKFLGSFILSEGDKEVCYIKYDGDIVSIPSGMERITQKIFEEKNSIYIENLKKSEVDFNKKVLELEDMNKKQKNDITNLKNQNFDLEAEKKKIVADRAALILELTLRGVL